MKSSSNGVIKQGPSWVLASSEYCWDALGIQSAASWYAGMSSRLPMSNLSLSFTQRCIVHHVYAARQQEFMSCSWQ